MIQKYQKIRIHQILIHLSNFDKFVKKLTNLAKFWKNDDMLTDCQKFDKFVWLNCSECSEKSNNEPNLSQQKYLGCWNSSVIYVLSISALKVSYKITRKMCTHFCSDCNIKFSIQDQKEHHQECGECNSIFKTYQKLKNMR